MNEKKDLLNNLRIFKSGVILTMIIPIMVLNFNFLKALNERLLSITFDFLIILMLLIKSLLQLILYRAIKIIYEAVLIL